MKWYYAAAAVALAALLARSRAAPVVVDYELSSLGAYPGGRSAYGPDWHGNTQGTFADLFGSGRDTYGISYADYASLGASYRAELDALPWVFVRR